MNTKAITDEITKLEREKAQLEVREESLRKEKSVIEEKLKARGIGVKELDARIQALREQVNTELEKLGLSHLVDTKAVANTELPIDEFETI